MELGAAAGEAGLEEDGYDGEDQVQAEENNVEPVADQQPEQQPNA